MKVTVLVRAARSTLLRAAGASVLLVPTQVGAQSSAPPPAPPVVESVSDAAPMQPSTERERTPGAPSISSPSAQGSPRGVGPASALDANPPAAADTAPIAPLPAATPGPNADAATWPQTNGSRGAPSAAQRAPRSEEPNARLDYADGAFYLRSAHDNLVLVPGARAHLDVYTFAGPGAGDYRSSNGTGLKPNLFFRRFVIELGGLVRKKWFFWLGGNFAPTEVDEKQAPSSTANVYDGFIGWVPLPDVRLYFGQFNAPFTMENVTSSRWLDLMERALMVRTLATPYNKADGLLLWGETHGKSFEYQIGAFGGDGMNRPNIDARFDGMARVVVRPLAARDDALKRLHIGISGRYGRRDNDFVRYDAPNLSTPGGYNFWSASYRDGDADTHILPSRRQTAVDGELYLPFERWDLKGEVLYINEQRREVLASDRARSLRGGALTGIGAYGQLSFWLLGSARIGGHPAGVYGVTKLPQGPGAEAPYALQLVLRGEILRLAYDANSRFGAEGGGPSSKTHEIDVNAYQVGMNYWATKHIRLSAQWSLYHFPGIPTTAMQGSDNQAVAPGARAGTRAEANSLHEISFRAGLAL